MNDNPLGYNFSLHRSKGNVEYLKAFLLKVNALVNEEQKDKPYLVINLDVF